MVFGVLVCFLALSVSRGIQNDDPQKLFWEANHALRFALEYFERHVTEVNLDAVIGTRIVEGQFERLLEKMKKSDINIPKPYIEAIQIIKEKAGKFSDLAVPFIKHRDSRYYHRIGPITDRNFWTMWYNGRDADPSLVTPSLYEGEAMNEETSDNCLAELFGTSKRSSKKCEISDKCWDHMSSPGYQLYSLSHQIFYLQCGLQFGCEKAIREKIAYFKQPSLDEQITSHCSNMLSEAKAIEKEGFVYDDLFMEQATLCGIFGFRQFFTPKWLRYIVNWQDKQLGCYTTEPAMKSQEKNQAGNRQKREEKLLDDNCLCHRTTVAMGALSQYMRYIIEYILIISHMNVPEPVII